MNPEERPTGIGALPPADLLARALNTVKPSAGAGSWTPPEPAELARTLPLYEITALIGRGGMGAVYRGVQTALDRPVAIKLLPPELAADEHFIARFRREAQTLARLQHPSIVTIYDFGQTSAGLLYFAMEYVDGTDLQRILASPGLNPAQALEIVSQVCDALHYAHAKDVIHRDIKPGNILITAEGRAKLADFGLARPITRQPGALTGTHAVMGTADYMAPEQQTGHADERADIFALGVTLYEMLTGQRPRGVFAPPSQRVQVDIRLDGVVLKALQQEPRLRYQQVSEMKTDVDHIRSTPPPAFSVDEEPAPSGWRRKPMLFAILGCALLAAGSAVHWRLWEKHPSGEKSSSPEVASASSASATALQQDLANQRKLAESVLSKHGSVVIGIALVSKSGWVFQKDQEWLEVTRSEDLPASPFHLRGVRQDHSVNDETDDFDDDDASLLASCHGLSLLLLNRCSLTSLPFAAMPNLQKLYVSKCRLTIASLHGLEGMPQLMLVHLEDMPLGGEIVRILAECPRLEYLTIGEVGLRDGDLQPLTRSKRLKELWINGNALSDDGLAVLADIASLEELTFGHMDFTSTKLTFLPQLKTISNVTLNGNEVPPAVSANLAKMPRLTSLSFSLYASITDEALRPLAGLASLKTLNLRASDVTDESIATLLTLTALQSLDIYDTAITAEGAATLRAALPDCKVRR